MKSHRDLKLEIAKKNRRAIEDIVCDVLDTSEANRIPYFKKTFKFDGVDFSFFDLVIADSVIRGQAVTDETIKYFTERGLTSDLLSEEHKANPELKQIIENLERLNVHSDQLSSGSTTDEEEQEYGYYLQLRKIFDTEPKAKKDGLLKLTRWGDSQYNGFHLAALFNDLDILQYWKQIKLSSSEVDRDGYNALHLVCNQSEVRLDTVKCLLKINSGMINAVVKYSEDTALHILCGVSSDTEIVRYMFSKGVAISQLNKNKESPFMVAVDYIIGIVEEYSEKRDLEILQLFVDNRNFMPRQQDLDKITELSEVIVEELKGFVNEIKKVIEQKLELQKLPSDAPSSKLESPNPSRLQPLIVVTPPTH